MQTVMEHYECMHNPEVIQHDVLLHECALTDDSL